MNDAFIDVGADSRRRIRSIFVGSVGNLIEWFDIYSYSAFALYFAGSFFPKGTDAAQQVQAWSLFSVTYLIRPVGGWLFGHLADRYGRRLSLTLSVVVMCLGSLMIALCPTYASVGIAAPIILTIARVIQGISLGGEYGTSATYLSEVADKKHRGFFSSFQYVTLIGGQLTAIFLLLLLQLVFLTPEELRAWGWRIPFAVGAVLSVVGALMRRTLQETEQFERAKDEGKVKHENSLITLLVHHPKAVAIVIGLTAGGTAAFYTFTTYMQVFLKLSVHLTDLETTYVTAGSLIFAVLLQPLYGAISDRIGRKPLLIGFGVLGTVCTVPILTTLHNATSPLICFLLICAAWLIVAGYTSINAVVKAELFPANVRATGVGVPYAITVAVFGGTAPLVAQKFVQWGHENYFYYYLSGIIFLSLLVYTTMADTKKNSLID
jgi:MHS family alpha-ketoglutarate permease-like MFS transporter